MLSNFVFEFSWNVIFDILLLFLSVHLNGLLKWTITTRVPSEVALMIITSHVYDFNENSNTFNYFHYSNICIFYTSATFPIKNLNIDFRRSILISINRILLSLIWIIDSFDIWDLYFTVPHLQSCNNCFNIHVILHVWYFPTSWIVNCVYIFNRKHGRGQVAIYDICRLLSNC